MLYKIVIKGVNLSNLRFYRTQIFFCNWS